MAKMFGRGLLPMKKISCGKAVYFLKGPILNQEEQRKHPRVRIYYPVTYACLDSDGHVIEERMATAVDISQSGMLIESADIVISEYVQLISIDLEENIIENIGKVAYCRRSENGKYRIGISFYGKHDTNIDFVKKIIRAYHYQKAALRPVNNQRQYSSLN